MNPSTAARRRINAAKTSTGTCNKQYFCIFVVYALFVFSSAIVFSFLEDLSYIDSLYFTVVTQTTVGYGDITPQTNAGLVFNLFFIFLSLGGIVILVQALLTYLFDSKINNLISEIKNDMKVTKQSKLNAAVARKTAAEIQRKISLCTFLGIYIVWVVIWVMFFALNPAEEPFNFFEAIYFAVVSSTTVGYGGFLPQSDGAKVFVFIFLNCGIMSLATVLSVFSEYMMDFIKKFEPESLIPGVSDKTAAVSHKRQLTNLLALTNKQAMNKHHYIVHRLLKTKKITNEEYAIFEREFEELDKDGNQVLDVNDLNLFDEKVEINPLLP